MSNDIPTRISILSRLSLLVPAFLLVLLTSCVQSVKRTLVDTRNLKSLPTDSPYFKAHLRNGEVYILRGWSIPADAKSIAGTGEKLNVHRERIAEGEFIVPMDSVVLCETNVVGTAGGAVAMSVVTGASVIMTIYCASNPKACFGSCPTFYAPDGTGETLQAEGFSSSVAPSLERQDIDALFRLKPTGRSLYLTMTNEALETHVVRYVRLLAARRPLQGRIVLDEEGLFYRVSRIAEPTTARGPEGDFRSLIQTYDGAERFSLSDSSDLAGKEELEFEFPVAGKSRVGLMIASRATLVSTFLFYQTLAFMGSKAGDWIASIERGEKSLTGAFSNPYGPLGGIEVMYRNSHGRWELAGRTGEQGPLASDIKLVPLDDVAEGPVQIRLRLSKGSWRLDHVALASLGEPVDPLTIHPAGIDRFGSPDERLLKSFLDPEEVVTTFPGERIVFRFDLPENPEQYEFFLDTKGYYLEWIRDEWLREENDNFAFRMFVDPAGMLRELAPEFKRREAAMEQEFWRSRYARQ